MASLDTAPGQMTGKPLIESDRVEGTSVYDNNGKSIGSIKRLMTAASVYCPDTSKKKK